MVVMDEFETLPPGSIVGDPLWLGSLMVGESFERIGCGRIGLKTKIGLRSTVDRSKEGLDRFPQSILEYDGECADEGDEGEFAEQGYRPDRR